MEIKGYRTLTGNEIDDINQIKELGKRLGEMLDYLKQPGHDYDQRWLAIGATQLQQGFMALTRAVAKPTTF